MGLTFVAESTSFYVTTETSSVHMWHYHQNHFQECFVHGPEFVSSLDKLLEYSLRFHIRIQRVTPVTQSH